MLVKAALGTCHRTLLWPGCFALVPVGARWLMRPGTAGTLFEALDDRRACGPSGPDAVTTFTASPEAPQNLVIDGSHGPMQRKI